MNSLSIDPSRRQTVLQLAALAGAAATGCATPSSAQRTVHIKVDVPPNTGTLYISGNLDSMGPWKPNGMALEGAGTTRTLSLAVPANHVLEYKFTLGSWEREALGPSGMVMPNFSLALHETQAQHVVTDFKKDTIEYLRNPQGSGIVGRMVVWESVASPLLRERRHVTVWLPPEYEANPNQRFGVVYAHDGQNLFDPRIANTGTDWGVDESITRLRAANRIEPTIVVGMWSTADRRLEYSPNDVIGRLDAATRADVVREFGGPLLGNAHLQFVANEIKPRVDAQFRTRPEPAHTTLMGSSMGGLISLYGLTQMPQVFGRAACLSVHWPTSISRQRIFVGQAEWQPIITQAWQEQLRALPPGTAQSQRLWVDRGDDALDSLYEPYQRQLVPVFEQAGYLAPRFVSKAFSRSAHNEAAWRARLDEVLGHVLAG
jgi:enterochelin esterase-like enzyme